VPQQPLHIQGNAYVSGNISAGNMGMFRNVLINGDMRINQRGTSTNLASMTTVAASAPGGWVTDRWNVYRGGYAAGASIGQGTGLGTADLPFQEAGIQTFARMQRVNGNTSTSVMALNYNMESQDSIRFAGKTVTLSFYYRTGANFSGAYIDMRIWSATGTDEARRNVMTGDVTVNSRGILPSSSWVRVSMSGTCATNIKQLVIGIDYAPTGTAGANDYYDITGVQLELGNMMTPFEFRPYAMELQLCQRYYYQHNTAFFVNCLSTTDANPRVTLTFPVTMRSIPIITGTAVGTFSAGSISQNQATLGDFGKANGAYGQINSYVLNAEL